MDIPQQLCVKWNHHQSNLLCTLDRLLGNESLVDVTLACEGSSVRAHKIVLSASSPLFEELFAENPCQHPIVILKDVSYADLTAMLEFMYRGEVNVPQEQLSTLLQTADALKIRGLGSLSMGVAVPTSPQRRSKRKRARTRRRSYSESNSDDEDGVTPTPTRANLPPRLEAAVSGARAPSNAVCTLPEVRGKFKGPQNPLDKSATVHCSGLSSVIRNSSVVSSDFNLEQGPSGGAELNLTTTSDVS